MKVIRPTHYDQRVKNQLGEDLMQICSESLMPLIGESIEVDGAGMLVVVDVRHRYWTDAHVREVWVEDRRLIDEPEDLR